MIGPRLPWPALRASHWNHATPAPPPTSAVAFSFSAFLLSLLPLMVLKGEFEDGVGFEFMVLWVDFLGEPVWDWCCVKPCGGWFLGEDFGFLDEPVWGVIG
uniref:Uncharacterized protein n=1 Tax=Fagus sylvatica TaxID=28930 RepID=A0A2N9GIT3_FAGSY